MYKRIVTHADFDGIVSAALCSRSLNLNFYVFTQPRLVTEARISITMEDVVCDLPYPLECGLWFDHHDGNLDELVYRNILVKDIPGRFEVKDSCARVVYEYFLEHNTHFQDFIENTVREADIIDSFNYESIDDWRSETPGKIIDASIKVKEPSAERKWEHLRNLARHLQDRPIEEVAQMASVRKRYRQYREEEERMIEQIREEIQFLPQDEGRRVILLDLTHHSRRPFLFKQLAYLIHPEAQAVLLVSNVFENDTKTNNLTFSMSLSLNMNKIEHKKDIGDIMRTLNLGSGHPGAAAGVMNCESKEKMLKTKDRLLNEIYDHFMSQ